MAAACAAILRREEEKRITAKDNLPSPWERTDGWMLWGRRSRRLSFRCGGQRVDAVLWYGREGVTLDYAGSQAPLRFARGMQARFDVTLGEATESVSAIWSGRDLDLTTPHGHFDLHWIDPFAAEMGEAEAGRRIVAPMPGTVTRVLAEPGADLLRGAPLLVLEAMKMEHTLRAPGDGRLKALKCAVGDFVQEGTELADFELAAE
jgi:3-methylcrotonyl-CoA carboxylase alpha subunit